jgi:hypothetical protein
MGTVGLVNMTKKGGRKKRRGKRGKEFFILPTLF